MGGFAIQSFWKERESERFFRIEINIASAWFYQGIILLHSWVAQGCGVASLAEGTAAALMHFPLLVMAGIWNLFMMPATARLRFAKDTMGYFMSINKCWHIRPRDCTYIDESTCLWNTGMTVYSWVGILTRLDSLEVSVPTSRLSCQPILMINDPFVSLGYDFSLISLP